MLSSWLSAKHQPEESHELYSLQINHLDRYQCLARHGSHRSRLHLQMPQVRGYRAI
jgi:hypothetical protein